MRIPDLLLDPPAFLCVESDRGLRMAGTAFFLGLRGGHCYLVTARHCVEKAQAHGGLYVRLNRKGGGTEELKLDNAWHFSESDADDVAVLSFPTYAALQVGFDICPIEIPVWCATDAIVASEGIGVGDELIAIGLFTHRDGKHKNRPIVRSGIIAAMPDEPLEDINSGLEYDAYLAEIRSIGGLSGTPVFVVLPPDRVNPDGTFEDKRMVFYLLGLVRGHWREQPTEGAAVTQEGDLLNTGIAIITPIGKAVEIIMTTDDFVRQRREQGAYETRHVADLPLD